MNKRDHAIERAGVGLQRFAVDVERAAGALEALLGLHQADSRSRPRVASRSLLESAAEVEKLILLLRREADAIVLDLHGNHVLPPAADPAGGGLQEPDFDYLILVRVFDG